MAVEQFFQIENALTAKLVSLFKENLSPLIEKVDAQLKAGNITEAVNLWEDMDLDYAENYKRFFEYVSNMGLIYGASLLSGTPSNTLTTIEGAGNTPELFSNLLIRSIILRGREYFVDTGVEWINSQAREFYQVGKAESGGDSILRPFQSFINEKGEVYFNVISSLHTSRVASYGFTIEAELMGEKKYKIVAILDGGTCEFCMTMHGKEFFLEDARSLLDIILHTDDPMELKNVQPWPDQTKETLERVKNSSSSELVNEGLHIPPFHPRCRCNLWPTTSSPKGVKAIGTEKVVTTGQDFEKVLPGISEKTLQTWNKTVAAKPDDILTALHGGMPEDLSGVSIKAVKDSIVLTSYTKAFGSTSPVEQKIVFRNNGNVFLDRLIIDGEDEAGPLAKEYMLSIFNMARTSNRAGLELVANLQQGGYAWAKYGFLPDADTWQALKKDIAANFSLAWFKELDTKVQAVIKLALQSDDPAMLYTFSDMKVKTSAGELVTKRLLEGTVWRGYLNFSSPEAVSRFLSYMGGS